MVDKIKKLTEITKELSKLLDVIEKLIWKIISVIAVIHYLLNQFN